MPATWWKVFTEVNDLFEAAKPDAKVLGRLAPWFSVADLEREQLGMVLLPPAQRLSQLVLQEEVMCWDQASLALTKDGYFTKEFAIKLHHCLDLAYRYNGGHYGDDRDSENEVELAAQSASRRPAPRNNHDLRCARRWRLRISCRHLQELLQRLHRSPGLALTQRLAWVRLRHQSSCQWWNQVVVVQRSHTARPSLLSLHLHRH